MYKIVEFSHLLIREYASKYLSESLTLVDATCGMGNDTIYMAKLVPTARVYSYDIQAIAINYAQKQAKVLNLDNITFKLQSHEFIDETPDLVLYNLGYLPTGDKAITTTHETTLPSITKIVKLININPRLLIIVVVYPGHPEGLLESNFLDDYVKSLDSSKYLVCKYQNYNRPSSPYLLTISTSSINP